jgi:SAM-dependent methyltransferase
MIARKNGGYKNKAVFTIEGISAEDIFEERLIGMLPDFNCVLDAGCGHGDFTAKMSRYASSIVGDYTAPELRKELELKIQENMINGKIGIKEYRFIWKANKA